ncbi:MAG: hypothetical protein ABI954_13760 [Pyrinomonadaceae bacterium]
MNFAAKISLLASGLFLLAAMIIGIVKYRQMIMRETHQANAYVDIAHRAALLYSFAALVIAELAKYSPFAEMFLFIIITVPLALFALTIAQYARLGWLDREETQFAEQNFITVWFMYGLIAGEIGGVALLVGGFVYTQFTQ